MDGIAGTDARPPCLSQERLPAKKENAGEDLNMYRWIPGECLKEYSESATRWKSHTSSTEFANAFKATAAKFDDDNDKRATEIEKFMLTEAEKAGVIKKTPPRSHKNPNKWAKHLAPWFNEQCRNARAAYRSALNTHGNHHA
jgi:hypothetical protein